MSFGGVGNTSVVGGGISISEGADECILQTSNIEAEYATKVTDAEENLEFINQQYQQIAEEYYASYADYQNDLKEVFEEEGGDMIQLEEGLKLLEKELGLKIIELTVSLDMESQKWRDEARLLDLEFEENKIELYSEVGDKTKTLAVSFFNWFKEHKQ